MEEIDDCLGVKIGTIFKHDSMVFMIFYDYSSSNLRVLNLKDGFCPENMYESGQELLDDFPGLEIVENIKFT